MTTPFLHGIIFFNIQICIVFVFIKMFSSYCYIFVTTKKYSLDFCKHILTIYTLINSFNNNDHNKLNMYLNYLVVYKKYENIQITRVETQVSS